MIDKPRFAVLTLLLAFSLMWVSGESLAQARIDSSLAFQNDRSKDFALYVPSSYSPGTPNKVIVAFHPLHATWGNSKTWCDILTTFAETNDLILLCPDGGQDGRVNDSIDTAFTAAVLDSVETWYTVNADKRFILAFSWGTRAAYNWGLDNADSFAGYLTLGAFFNAGMLTPAQLTNAEGKPFYIMHGDADNVANINVGFFPVRDALVDAGAVVESLVLDGVTHTINFRDRDQILTDAFRWLDETSSRLSTETEDVVLPSHQGLGALLPSYPNPFSSSTTLGYAIQRPARVRLQIYNLVGQVRRTLVDREQGPGEYSISWNGLDENGRALPVGVYISSLTLGGGRTHSQSLILVR